jgi:predicted alpha/beta superfamily hydrolase
MTPRENLRVATPEYGILERPPLFYSDILGNARQLIIYLPPDYDTDVNRRYPVLYMQDGQNLFDGTTSYVPGQHWHLNETADNLIHEGAIEPLIIVGIYNMGEHRIQEYTPTTDPNFKVGGQASLYGRMLAEELKPYIDRTYRTKPEREHTGIGGSSLGGLSSLYLGLMRHSDVFGRVIAMSPSLWWDKCWLLRNLDELMRSRKTRVWIDAGTSEGANTECNAEALRNAMIERGFTPDEEVKFMRDEGARHSEQDWAHRVHHGLRFTFIVSNDDESSSLPELLSSTEIPHAHNQQPLPCAVRTYPSIL